MSDTVIKVEGLSKRYRLGQYVGGAYQYRALRDVLADAIHAPFRRLRVRSKQQAVGSNPTTMSHQPSTDFIWALKDISFEVKQGEVVGIIGRNGAGKTTLLKVLSRITEPTKGRAEIKGRIQSLLEVGTGFHPELTGRENIYLSGAILGMTKREIERKFDEIVDFSEIEKFIDTPVKRYSSGMLVRLGFAVAAHLEPEILLVDEVLAVGDAAFQKKCLGKMGEISNEGRTVLFVSHNMDAIVRLCNSAIYLRSGRILIHGPATSVVERYISSSFSAESRSVIEFDTDTTDRKLVFNKVCLISSHDRGQQDSSMLKCHIDYQVLADSLGAVMAVRIDSISGTPVMTLTDNDLDERHFIKKRGTYRAICPLSANLLAAGTYRLTISAADMKGTRFDYHEGILSFNVAQSPKIKPTFRREGPLLVPINWQVQEIR